VTDRDRQLDDELKQLLGDIDIPPADDRAKRRAIAMARSEFELARREVGEKTPAASQGLFGWLRLIVGNKPDNRRAVMPFTRKLMYSGVAAAAVGAIAVGITLQNPTSMRSASIGTGYEKQAHTIGEGKLTSVDAVAGGSLEEVIVTARKAEREVDFYTVNPSRVARLADESAAAAPPSELRQMMALEEAAVTAQREDMSLQQRAIKLPAPGLVAPAADADVVPSPHYQDVGRDTFEEFEQNRVMLVSEAPVSTFSVDVDTAAYSFVRRMLNAGVLPQGDAVRAEELINYFDYDYPLPDSKEQPFRATVAVSDAPWAEGRKLMHIGIKGYDIAPAAQPRSNLVFLLDVSGSMNSPDKLPLVIQSMELLLSTLNPDDTVAIAVYAGAAGVVLEPTPVGEKRKILDALHRLSAGGSTAGAQGIRLAYELAESQFDRNAVNRVILATDGDFNVGITNQRELQSFIERKRDAGIFLSVLGFGQGNYQDALMQTLAQNGNGVAAYIDTLSEAQKVLVDEATSTLFPIAKDVKIQVEFNPATVAEYRLIGYETRHLNREDFNNDAVDAGDIGAGHTVTAIYEFTPVGSSARQIEDSRYAPAVVQAAGRENEYAFVKIRYKLPEENTSRLITQPVTPADAITLGADGIGREAGFATAVAGFAQLLKGGKYTGYYDYDDVIELAQRTRGDDPYGYRNELVQLVRKAKTAAAMQRR